MEAEHSLLKSQYEILNRSVRTSQKLMDRDVNVLKKAAKQPWGTKEEAVQKLDKLIARLEGLQSKVEQADKEEDKIVDMLQSRVEYLKKVASAKEEKEKSDATRMIAERLVGSFLLEEGFVEVAESLNKGASQPGLLDINIYKEAQAVIAGLAEHSCKAGLAWCALNSSKLKKSKSVFEFNLRLQEYIELVREDKEAEAIKYAQSFFPPFAEACLDDISFAMGLVIFKGKKVGDYHRLLDESRWEFLREEFEDEISTVYSLPDRPLLLTHLHAGLSALKTPACTEEEEANVNCPSCAQPYQTMAQYLPVPARSHSRLVCRVSGKVMDSDNPPMALPNGMVYSKEVLEKMAEQHGGFVTCPRTQETFHIDTVRKVFIL